ncbi:MAG: DUF4145 domain-containing protein [Balneolales bacterium]
MSLLLTKASDKKLIDQHFRVKCPHCMTGAGLSAVSIPKYDLLERYQPKSVGLAYQCDVCQETVFLRFKVQYNFPNHKVTFFKDYEEVERPQETYDFKYLPEVVGADFREALDCYSNANFNAFAAMSRRTIQTASQELGSKGKDKVLRQIEDLRSMAEIDEETFESLKAIVIAGHDGAHPHLPSLSDDRAEILLELMKDILYQLFVRKKKLEEAAARRREAIEQKKQDINNE